MTNATESRRTVISRQGADLEAGKTNVKAVHDPEDLIRNETFWINCLRGFLIGTLVVVTAGTAWAVYKLSSKWEYNSFHHDFETVAERISETFLKGTTLQIWIASFALNSFDDVVNGRPAITNQRLKNVFRGSQRIANVRRMGYSPLIRSAADQALWEAYAKQAVITQDVVENICYVCGEGMEVGNPSALVTVPTVGPYPCSDLQTAGLEGFIVGKDCPTLQPFVQKSCQCQPTTNPSDEGSGQTNSSNVSAHVFRFQDGERVDVNGSSFTCPVWQLQPKLPTTAMLFDQMSSPIRRRAISTMMKSALPTFSLGVHPHGNYEDVIEETETEPLTSLFIPVFDTKNSNLVVGTVFFDFLWSYILGTKMPFNGEGVVFVIENSRGQAITYQIQNYVVNFVGEGDLHDSRYESLMRASSYDDFKTVIVNGDIGHQGKEPGVMYRIRIYPSDMYLSRFTSNKPVVYAVTIILIFVFTSIMFVMYDCLVGRRQTKVMASAKQTDAIVTSLFPESIKARLIESSQGVKTKLFGTSGAKLSLLHHTTPKSQLKTMLNNDSNMAQLAHRAEEPIADFFPNVTVIFADIAGFTAWSSEREPSQVFQLLETAYQTFDKIARRLGVFKIETIGDCYVAVVGIPEPLADHAVRMARFAHEIMLHMHELALSLESLLGPGTGSLSLRIGLHSGPVTGGVLRGEKARFQLFGDTMNTTSRMQTTGHVDMIQASQATANLLTQAGHAIWLRPRGQSVFVKGKGETQTFWVNPSFAEAETSGLLSTSDCSDSSPAASSWGDVRHEFVKSTQKDKFDRLVSWNTDLLLKFLQKVVAVKNASRRSRRKSLLSATPPIFSDMPLKDVTEVITMSDFSGKQADDEQDSKTVQLREVVCLQLHDFVSRVASMYRDNPFHNFEHACHVAMSACKIINRIVKPEDVDYHQELVKKKNRKRAVAHQIHQSTFGISSDALMQFAVVFSAVIHDVDHSGVSNAQLVKESDPIAVKFDNKCVLEQNSVQIAWDILMEDKYQDLRACIFNSDEEKQRFRQLIVNAVIATDIADKELQALRKHRWNNAFYRQGEHNMEWADSVSCKATVVFEYIIQASDVAHTMQHWRIYNTWNERLFEERYRAYLAGREEVDPSLGWYDGEIGFFDNYIIPLARKLETCGVFGVSSDEYLNYALENRHEWSRKGRGIVHSMVQKYKTKANVGFADIEVMPTVEEDDEESNSL